MKKFILVLFLPLGFFIGCGDQSGRQNQQSAPSREGTRESNPVHAPAEYVGAVLNAQQHASVRMSIVTVSEAVKGFKAFEGRLPRNLGELEEKGLLPGGLPELPVGLSFHYNPETGEVTVPR